MEGSYHSITLSHLPSASDTVNATESSSYRTNAAEIVITGLRTKTERLFVPSVCFAPLESYRQKQITLWTYKY
jgi:hypothetical protein